MKKITKEDKIHVLRQARQRIKLMGSYYVCFALCPGRFEYGGADHPRRQAARLYLKSEITKSLGGRSTVSEWLAWKHPKICATIKDFREYRLAWIDEMIKQVEAGQL